MGQQSYYLGQIGVANAPLSGGRCYVRPGSLRYLALFTGGTVAFCLYVTAGGTSVRTTGLPVTK